MGFDLYRRDNLREPRSYSEEAYFRSTSKAWGVIYEVMLAVGILDVSMDAPDPSDTSEESRAARSVEPEAVPAYKLSSNDHWLVTPEECLVIAGALERAVRDTRARLQPSPDDEGGLGFIERFARFNRIAADYGGYVAS